MSLDKARAAIVQAYIDAGLNLPTFYENKPGDPPASPIHRQSLPLSQTIQKLLRSEAGVTTRPQDSFK